MQTQTQLDAAIAALPGAVTTAVVAAVQPLIAAGQPTDFTTEVAAIQAIPAQVAAAVVTALTPVGTTTTTTTPQ